MNMNKALKALQDHAKEEIRIHKDIFGDTKGDVRHLVKKHLSDTISIHKAFWKDLKKAAKSK